MNRPEQYHTKHGDSVLDFIVSHRGSHVTAAQISEHFARRNTPIARTTIYRQLERLVRDGKVRKYIVDELSGACFQYAGDQSGCDEHFHLKCEQCGHLFHVQCDQFMDTRKHIFEDHAFEMNAVKTVFYGTCKDCIQGEV